MERQPRLLDDSQRNTTVIARLGLQHRHFRSQLPFYRDDLRFEPAAVLRTQHVCPAADEPPPFTGGAQRTLAGGLHLQHILGCYQITAIQPSLERPGCLGAVVHGDFGVVASIDADFDQRAAPRPSAAQLHEVVTDRVKLRYDNIFKRVLHISSRQSSGIKKCGEPPPHSARGHKDRVAT